MICNKIFPIFSLLFILSLAHVAYAVTVAPRISDREIIERLAKLEEGQKSLRQVMKQGFNAMQTQMDQRFNALQSQMDQRFQAVDQRFHAVDQRFQAVDQRFNALETRMDQRFDAMDAQNERIRNLMLVVIGGIMGLIAAIVGLIGYIIWDRKTTLHPLEQRLCSL